MSLALLQGYSSAEEDFQEERDHNFSDDSDSGSDSDSGDTVSRRPSSYNPIPAPKSSPGSALPSALDAFSQVSGPPQFLNNTVEDQSSARDSIIVDHRYRIRRRGGRNKKDLPSSAVLEAKAQLVGIHERVRSDVEGNTPSNQRKDGASQQPSLCLQCGIPKTYSSALGMVCPVCPSDDAKKKGSTVKDKEKIKRMRGQSSHATWKTETEMQLRQTFD